MTRSLGTEPHKYFVDLLVNARAGASITQADLAHRLSRPQSFVSKYENGERRLDVIEFIEVANAIGIDPSLTVSDVNRRFFLKSENR